MKRILGIFFSLIFLMTCAFATVSSPLPTLQTAANQLISKLQQHQTELKSNPTLINGFVRSIVLPHVAEEQMARAVVNRVTWNNASTADQQQFVAAFENLVIRTYASAFANYTNESVKFLPLRTSQLNKSYLTVNSNVIRPNGPSIPVAYSMSFMNGKWLVTDFSVDGVSMVNSFRSQFASLDTGKGLAALTAILQKHNSAKATS